MANLDFFGAHDDLANVLEFLFSTPDLRVFEMYSPYGEELKQFHSVPEMEKSYILGIDRYGNGSRISLQLWFPAVMAEPKIERIALNPKSCAGHTFRYNITGSGLIQLYLGGVHGNCITKSHYGHNSHKRALNHGIDQGVDREALEKVSRKIQYHIRSRLAVAKVPGRPVLPQAYELARQGFELKEAVNVPWRYELEQQASAKD